MSDHTSILIVNKDGRRTSTGGSFARTNLPPTSTGTSNFDAANHLTSWNGATLSYDANGNLTSDGSNTYMGL